MNGVLERRRNPVIILTMILAMGFVLLGDVFTPVGIVVWVFYLIPVVLSYLLWQPRAPLIAAVVCTLLVILGYLLSPPGEISQVRALINRSFAFATIWVLAGIGYNFIRNKLAVRKQEWLQTGHGLLSRDMAGDPTPEALGDQILKSLAEYLGAQAGAMFIAGPDGYSRVSTYGVPPGVNLVQSFKSGEGLLGQAAKDRRSFTLDEIPPGYLEFGSALGKAPPRHLVIAPFMVDNEVNSVVELGFLKPPNENVRELMERISEAAAMAVRSAQYRMKLQELLHETQAQAEELQAQSEELRVTNEELEEQSRALKESQSRLEQQQAELEQNNSQLQWQTRELEERNDELKRSKQILELQARDLEQASRYKSEFLANMSHELRTPLNSALILAKLLGDNRENNLTADQVKYARTIESAGNDLLRLINDVLDLAKVEAGRVDMRTEEVSVAALADGLKSTFQPVAAQRGLELTVAVGPKVPERIQTDSQRLEQVLKNLLSNALKFTERGSVRLEVTRPRAGRVSFAVSDTGIGIPEHQQRVIFEPFYQADGTTNRKYGGTGLGLSISRQFARLLGGDIQVASEPGRGSTFTLNVPETLLVAEEPPARVAAAPELSPIAPAPTTYPEDSAPAPARITSKTGRVADDREKISGKKRVILLVEDDETFAGIIYNIARELGFQALIATSAEEALALAAQFLPHAVVLDIGLPDRSGLSVLERLKKDARTRHIPVHVVSASDYEQKALSMGAVGYMLKPVKREQLVSAFERLETQLIQKLRRVLVVEDDPVQLESLKHLLQSGDVAAVGVRSAAECLDKLQTDTFDCMVLDLSLPDASGFALLETLSNEDKYAFPPVIVYTGRDLSQEEEQKLRKYSKSIIIKGAKSPERLLDEVTLFLHQVVSELPPEQQKLLEKARKRDAVLEGRHILVVEDDVRNVFALNSILEPQGVRTTVARNGREALEKLEQSLQAKENAVDLVLMDIMMPEMDGLTAMREIRKRPEWKQLPIIALTAKAMKGDQEQSLEAGANDYMAKPLDVEKMLSLVSVWMPR